MAFTSTSRERAYAPNVRVGGAVAFSRPPGAVASDNRPIDFPGVLGPDCVCQVSRGVFAWLQNEAGLVIQWTDGEKGYFIDGGFELIDMPSLCSVGNGAVATIVRDKRTLEPQLWVIGPDRRWVAVRFESDYDDMPFSACHVLQFCMDDRYLALVYMPKSHKHVRLYKVRWDGDDASLSLSKAWTTDFPLSTSDYSESARGHCGIRLWGEHFLVFFQSTILVFPYGSSKPSSTLEFLKHSMLVEDVLPIGGPKDMFLVVVFEHRRHSESHDPVTYRVWGMNVNHIGEHISFLTGAGKTPLCIQDLVPDDYDGYSSSFWINFVSHSLSLTPSSSPDEWLPVETS